MTNITIYSSCDLKMIYFFKAFVYAIKQLQKSIWQMSQSNLFLKQKTFEKPLFYKCYHPTWINLSQI